MMFPKPQRRTTPADWDKVRKDLEKRCDAIGLIYCELNLEGCFFNRYLHFAHRLKRADIKTIEELYFAIRACDPCHGQIEYEPDMYEIVTFIHDNRKIQP